MIFRQLTHDDLGCASYLIGDEDAGVAAVVDPGFEIDEYLELARYMGVSIEHIFETHNHADHVSGHGRLAAATGATIHIHRAAAPDYDHEPFEDGAEWQLGSLRVRALHTPGHRPEHTAFVLIDTDRGEDPWAVLTGDTLFVNDIARPDLAIEKSEGARGIFRSLRDQLLPLPDQVEVWPGHLGHGGMTSWRQEKQPVERIERVPLEALAGRAEQDAGLQILDVREQGEWAAGHIPGSTFTPWHDIDGVPEALDGRRPIAVICASGQRAAVAAGLLQRSGAARVIHVVEGEVGTARPSARALRAARDGFGLIVA